MRRFCIVVLIASIASACTTAYFATDLSGVSLGATKADFVKSYTHDWKHPPVARAAKVVGSDTIEVLTMPVHDHAGSDTDYWFLFRNSRLAQWGKPEDWKNVAATYQIEYNPVLGVRTP